MQFSRYQKNILTPPQAIILATSMINFIENMQKLRVSNAATCQNVCFNLQQKRVNLVISLILLIWLVIYYYFILCNIILHTYRNIWSGVSTRLGPYIHFQFKINLQRLSRHESHIVNCKHCYRLFGSIYPRYKHIYYYFQKREMY